MNIPDNNASMPKSIEEIRKRNFPGRAFVINQKNVQQLQLDMEFVLKEYDKLVDELQVTMRNMSLVSGVE